MFINNGTGFNAGYVAIGLNYNAPKFPLHVVGDVTSVFPQGWNRAITVSHNGAIAFLREGSQIPGANNDFFMGAPSSSPNGDFYLPNFE